jgi:hypothetical protein
MVNQKAILLSCHTTVFAKQSQFTEAQSDVMPSITVTYGDFGGWMLRKNKANSKPIKANLPAVGGKS